MSDSFTGGRPRWKPGRMLVPILLAGLASYWVVQTFRHGRFQADPSGVTMITSTRPPDGERDVLINTYISAYLNAGHAIDPHSLNAKTVRLIRAGNGREVDSQVNTSAAGDDIVLTPRALLDPSTRYIFQIKGVKDMRGVELMPFEMSFTTSAGHAAEHFPVGFEKIDLAGQSLFYTWLAIGPDHRLYAGSADGKIIRRDILAGGLLGPEAEIETVRNANHGPRLITGVAFDPKSTAENLILWISHGQFIGNQWGDPSLVGAQEWTGKISVLSGPDLSSYRDVVVGLPRSFRDHLNNQPAFGPDGCLYWSQGSLTAMGAPTPEWGGSSHVERLLSAAVLRLDPSKVHGTLDAKTRDGGGTYDPFAVDAPLTIYASGVRVGFDMLWTSSGFLYTATNGSAAGARTPGTPSSGRYPRRIDQDLFGPYAGPEVPALTINQTQPDMLLRLDKGGYYGHPNPSRGEYVLNGGNPTAGRDPYEVPAYPVGTMPDRNWRKPVYSFGISVSPNGMLQYQTHGKVFGGALDGKLMITRFSGGRDIIVLSLDAQGNVTQSITGIAGLTNLTQPLDVMEDPESGCVYVAQYGGKSLTLLRPITNAGSLAALEQNVFVQQVGE